jgi:threonine dehydrogenase-like Zn-dependent dehydrogenase
MWNRYSSTREFTLDVLRYQDLHEYTMGPNLLPKSPHPITGEKVPLTLGHEFSGVVEVVGQGVHRFKPGDRVILEPIIFDGDCQACQAGYFNCCSKNGFVGISGYGGGFAEHIVLDEKYLNFLPDGVSLQVGGILLCSLQVNTNKQQHLSSPFP